ncbi:TetR/AcrR family transcriptional regulator [Nocardia nova]|uniref:TetR/AcrR family transcriptional regulator n=1 Tax=Nocardia nova TaxID=37330 RepID=UPI000CE9D662|nr:helix-turn-helix domain-containing protein [Nocardia nova]PPJ25762.1 hypothetical protein C5E41_18990 [Nocardia nova]
MGAPAHIGRPTGADGDRTRRRIQTAAMNHMADVGYANATMKAIAEQANVTSAAIYHHFRSKEALVVDTLVSTLDEVMRRLEAAAAIESTLVGDAPSVNPRMNHIHCRAENRRLEIDTQCIRHGSEPLRNRVARPFGCGSR